MQKSGFEFHSHVTKSSRLSGHMERTVFKLTIFCLDADSDSRLRFIWTAKLVKQRDGYYLGDRAKFVI